MKVLPLFGIFAAALVVMSSGAFTSVTADRTATISVVGDSNALIKLTAGSSELVYMDDDDLLTIDLSAVDATGVNLDAVTLINNAFTITNNSNTPVNVVLTEDASANDDAIDFGSELEGGGVALDAGDDYVVNISIDTHDVSAGTLISSIEIAATATG